jgi:8-oxo-dGTP diphosphatase
VAAAIVHQGRVLAVQRSATMSEPLSWEFPGGKVEKGETDAEALIREIQEELGIQVAVGAQIASSQFGPIHLLLYDCQWASGDICLIEHAQLQWLSASSLSHTSWAPADVPLLPALRAHYATTIAP